MTDKQFLHRTATLLATTARKTTGGCCGSGEWIQMSDAEARDIAKRLREIAKRIDDANTT